MKIRLGRDFFYQPTLTVAKGLLGAELVIDHGGWSRRGRIIETEAYLGLEDQASHAAKGRTTRTAPMFGPAGFTYVYLVYGLHWCLNIVTEAEGYPAAVLLRALETIDPQSPPRTASGPGKLSRWLGIDSTWNRVDVTSNIFYIESNLSQTNLHIQQGKRIGVDYAGIWATKPWRFGVTNHPELSQKINH